MQALLSVAPGGPETLELTTLPDPTPKSREILVRVRAAGVNFPDTLMINDLYQIKPPRPFAPGGEISGDVIALGPDTSGFAIGDRVLALTGYGGFSTHLNIKAQAAIPFPASMPYDDAACFVFTYGTSYHALKDRAALRAGETLLVLGAAGGVGRPRSSWARPWARGSSLLFPRPTRPRSANPSGRMKQSSMRAI